MTASTRSAPRHASVLSDPRLAAPLLVVGFAATAVLLAVYWPAGVLLGVVAGVLAVFRIGVDMQRAAQESWIEVRPADLVAHAAAARAAELAATVAAPAAVESAPLESAPLESAPLESASLESAPLESAPLESAPEEGVPEEGVRGDLERLKAELGDVWPDFARAARLVVSTQYASAARLQRELQVPYSRARRILDDLESEHFVGPATGSLPRQVLLPKERLPEVERLFAAV